MDDRELHDRLHRAVQGASPDSAQLWENVMTASEHARKVRNAKRTGIAMTLLAFAIATPIAIKLAGSSPDENNCAGGGGNGTTSPTPSPSEAPAPSATGGYVDQELNVSLAIPEGWRMSEFEGHRTLYPQHLKAPPQDGDTAYVSLAWGDLAPRGGREDTTFAGLPAQTVATENGNWIVVPNWPVSPYLNVVDPLELSIWFEASTSELADEHTEGAESIFDSIQPLWGTDGSFNDSLYAGFQTRRGAATSDVELNGATAAVAGFMDTRAWVEDYGTFITDEAMQQYIDLEMPDGTSRRDFPEKWFLDSYRIVSADAADANSWEIVVEIHFVKYGETAADEERATISERLFVGPGTATDGTERDNVIRGVVDEA
jgi:hypothetical protein